MTGFLSRLAARAAGAEPAVRLRPESRFEQGMDTAGVVRARQAQRSPSSPAEAVTTAASARVPTSATVVRGQPSVALSTADPAGRSDAQLRPGPADTPRAAGAEATSASGSDASPATRSGAGSPAQPGRTRAASYRASGPHKEPPQVDVRLPESAAPKPAPAESSAEGEVQTSSAAESYALGGVRDRDRAGVRPDLVQLVRDHVIPALVDFGTLDRYERVEVSDDKTAGNESPAGTGTGAAPHPVSPGTPTRLLLSRSAEIPTASVGAGQPPEVHLHIDRIEVVRPSQPKPQVTRAAVPPVDHQAYLARRRAQQR